jgi:hypothetical protein
MLKKETVKMCTGMSASGEILDFIRADTHSQFNINLLLTLQCRSQYLIPEGFKSHAAVVRI